MFRKPKRKVKDTLRTRKTEDEDDDDNNKKAEASAQSNAGEEDEDDESSTSELIREARKRVKKTIGAATATTSTTGNDNDGKAKIMHSYATSSTRSISHAERATSTAQHLPEKLLGSGVAGAAAAAGPKDDNDGVDNARDNKAQRGEDGIFRDQTRNKFWAGPIRAAANVRVTARFDYQPDICKDYKDTGFCGFGDTCIYLHDRGDTLAGWQIDQQWELEQKRKKDAQEKEMQNFLDAKSGNNSGGGGGGGDGITIEGGGSDDGLPFACFLCREYFKDPVVTTCQHYFCQDCIMDHVRNNNGSGGSNSNTDSTSAAFCPICNKDTHGVFHQPTKLLAKKRKALGSSAAAKAENSWEEFYKLYSTSA